LTIVKFALSLHYYLTTKKIKMKKTLLLSALAIALLTSCSKEEVDCNQGWAEYNKEINHYISTGQYNSQKNNIILQQYNQKYPNCGFK
jgi:outer membrane biogenesis lipoprotein LolB